MPPLSVKQKIIAFIVILGLILIAIFAKGVYSTLPSEGSQPSSDNPQVKSAVSENDPPQVVSTSPSPLDKTIILPTQTIEITFNKPLANEPETRVALEPSETEVKKELSPDKKTLKISPVGVYPFGQGYTIFIKADTKFQDGGILGHDEVYHIRTIEYKGV